MGYKMPFITLQCFKVIAYFLTIYKYVVKFVKLFIWRWSLCEKKQVRKVEHDWGIICAVIWPTKNEICSPWDYFHSALSSELISVSSKMLGCTSRPLFWAMMAWLELVASMGSQFFRFLFRLLCASSASVFIGLLELELGRSESSQSATSWSTSMLPSLNTEEDAEEPGLEAIVGWKEG